MTPGVRIDLTVTSGFFQLEGGSWPVDNNVWIVGDDHECLVIDGPHDAAAIAAATSGRRVVGIVCTHGHSDHVNAAPELADAVGAPIHLHPADTEVWVRTHPQRRADLPLEDGENLVVGGVELSVIHTPGHTPGSCCLYAPALGTVFSGDTLFEGGPGATGRAFSDFPTIIESIRSRLLTLPPQTVVRTGHGPTTTIGAEAPHLDEWIARGY